MKKLLLILLSIAIISLSGCTDQNPMQNCIQVITPAISPEGECTEFPTPCDVPKGFTLVDSCEQDGPPIEEITCPDGHAVGETWEDECNTCSCTKNGEIICTLIECEVEKPVILEEPKVTDKFDFDSKLMFCEFTSLMKKYTMFYRIRNRTENIPTYHSKIWLKVPDLNNYGQAKTIQKEYVKDQVLWEEQELSYLGYGTLRGQNWEIRNQDTNSTVDFQLIYCEPEFASKKEDCTPETGIIVFEGNTGELCKLA